MGKILNIILISGLLILFDLYIYKAILSIYPKWKNNNAQKRFGIIWWGYSILLLTGVFCSMFFNLFDWLRSTILVLFFITFVSKLFFVIILSVGDLKRFIVNLFKKEDKITPEKEAISNENKIPRSEFLVKSGIFAAAIPFSTLSYGIASGAYDYQIKRQVLKFPHLPSQFEGMTFAQISDVHSGSFYNKKAVLGGVEMLLNEKPEMVFFTGDLVNNKANEMRDYQDIFAKIKAPLGVFSTLGNHDYGMYQPWPTEASKKKNLDDLVVTHKNMGWDLLMNENRKIKIGNDEIGILGVENWGGGRFPKFGKMEEAIKNTDDLPIKLLLSHDPSHWREEILKKYPQIDAMFAGHTHGFQFGVNTESLKWSPSQYIYKEWAGLYQEQNQQLYVNVGYGFLGYPGRVGILPEITIFELRKA